MKTETPLPALFFHGTVRWGSGLPSSGLLTMHCLWSWVMTKASRDPEAPPPTLPRGARGSTQSAPDGSCEVGSAAPFHGSSERVPLAGQLAIEHIGGVCTLGEVTVISYFLPLLSQRIARAI